MLMSARPKEYGCIAYTFAVDVVDPNVVRMSEAWRDQESLETHLADDEFQGVGKELVHIRPPHRHDRSEKSKLSLNGNAGAYETRRALMEPA